MSVTCTVAARAVVDGLVFRGLPARRFRFAQFLIVQALCLRCRFHVKSAFRRNARLVQEFINRVRHVSDRGTITHFRSYRDDQRPFGQLGGVSATFFPFASVEASATVFTNHRRFRFVRFLLQMMFNVEIRTTWRNVSAPARHFLSISQVRVGRFRLFCRDIGSVRILASLRAVIFLYLSKGRTSWRGRRAGGGCCFLSLFVREVFDWLAAWVCVVGTYRSGVLFAFGFVYSRLSSNVYTPVASVVWPTGDSPVHTSYSGITPASYPWEGPTTG